MVEEQAPRSFLAADIGTALTHVCLIDQIEGTYRFVAHADAPTTLQEPENDILIGLIRAVKHLEFVCQRPLLDNDNQIITPETSAGEGVDAVVATANAAAPLRCVIVGLTNDLSVESARRACTAANAMVSDTVALSKRLRRWDNQALAAMHEDPPEVIVLVGGIDAGPVAPIESAARVFAALYDDTESERRPIIVFAGNQEARRPIARILSPIFDFRVVENVRPSTNGESLGELQREITDIYTRRKLTALPGYRTLTQWCHRPIASSHEALGTLLRFIARRNELPQGVLGLDVGASAVFAAVASGKKYNWTANAQAGSSYGVSQIEEPDDLAKIRRWLPVSLSAEDTIARLENARLRPQSIPQTMEELLLVHAVVRQSLLRTMRILRPSDQSAEQAPVIRSLAYDLIAARGGVFAHTPQDGITTLTILDAIQPVGLTRLVVDWASIWPQLGAIAMISPLAAAQVLERDGFRELGTVLAPIGEARDGEPALELLLIRESLPDTEIEIPAGTIQCFPLGLEEHAIIEVRPTRDFDIGMGRKGVGGRAQVRGGTLGLIIDTRGRPLALPENARYARRKMQQWLESLINHVNEPS